MRAVDGVLFDFGGVVVDGPFEALAAHEREIGAPAGTVRRINSRNPDANAWARVERGAIGIDEFAALFEEEARALGVTLDGRRVLEVIRRMPAGRADAREELLGAVDRCDRLGVRTGLLTNNVLPMADSSLTAWVFDVFDPVVESCVIGTRKPDPAIYAHALARLGLPANRVAMLDDLGINLKPARELGLRTIKVVGLDAALAELDALLD